MKFYCTTLVKKKKKERERKDMGIEGVDACLTVSKGGNSSRC
jgi:hypothetical protein